MNTGVTLLPVLVLLSLAFLSSCTGTSDTVVPRGKTTTSISTPTVQADITDSAPVDTQAGVSSTPADNSSIQKSVSYRTDHGKHVVTANFTLTTDSSGLITAAKATMKSGDRESQQYINRFNSAAKSQIVGKKVSSLSLSAVGGASDTTDAFMQAVSSL